MFHFIPLTVYIKGKSAIQLARVYGENRRNFVGQHFWARGYFVSTVGRDEAVIRAYIRHQEQEDQRIDQLNLLGGLGLVVMVNLVARYWHPQRTPLNLHTKIVLTVSACLIGMATVIYLDNLGNFIFSH